MEVGIPLRRNRKQLRDYDKALYRHRRLVENTFFSPQTLAKNCQRYAKKYRIVPGHPLNQLHRTLGDYLMRTFPRLAINLAGDSRIFKLVYKILVAFVISTLTTNKALSLADFVDAISLTKASNIKLLQRLPSLLATESMIKKRANASLTTR